MEKFSFLLLFFYFMNIFCQNSETVLNTAKLVNDYFMAKYPDPTQATNVGKIRPSNLWTRAVYYEGLMELNSIYPKQEYLEYSLKWADFHKWTPRNGVRTTDADDQCCGQTYINLLKYVEKEKQMSQISYLL